MLYFIFFSVIFLILGVLLFGFSQNNVTLSLLSTLGGFLLTISSAFLISKTLRKRDVRKREKKTSVNYLIIAALALIVGGSLLVSDIITSGKLNGFFLSIVIFAVAGSIGMYRTSKMNNIVIESALKHGQFVIFLRSFNSNKIISKPSRPFSSIDCWQMIFGKKFDLVESLDRTSLQIEMYLARILSAKDIPFIALGDPEDYLPPPGAQKTYTDDENWQDLAADYIEKSGRILLLEGASDGLMWELNYIRNNIPPSRVILITYPESFRRRKTYQKTIDHTDFCSKLKSYGYDLPENDLESGAVFGFDQAWKPVMLGQGTEFMIEFDYMEQ